MAVGIDGAIGGVLQEPSVGGGRGGLGEDARVAPEGGDRGEDRVVADDDVVAPRLLGREDRAATVGRSIGDDAVGHAVRLHRGDVGRTGGEGVGDRGRPLGLNADDGGHGVDPSERLEIFSPLCTPVMMLPSPTET